jgi:hypothetical protein
MNEKDMTDDFLSCLGETEFLSGKTTEDKSTEAIPQAPTEVIPQAPTDVISTSQEEITDSAPELAGLEFPPEYLKMVERVKIQYKLLPSLNYDAIYREITELTVNSVPTPTLEVLNDELYKVQAAKDRLSEIFMDVIKCYNFKKRAVDILKDSWGKFTSEKNTEGRKGDAAFRLSYFMIDFSKTESLSKACDHILKNLDSLQDNLSRRITIWQLLLKLKEGRMALPDHDFGKDVGDTKMDDLFNDNKGGNNEEKEESGIKLREF